MNAFSSRRTRPAAGPGLSRPLAWRRGDKGQSATRKALSELLRGGAPAGGGGVRPVASRVGGPLVSCRSTPARAHAQPGRRETPGPRGPRPPLPPSPRVRGHGADCGLPWWGVSMGSDRESVALKWGALAWAPVCSALLCSPLPVGTPPRPEDLIAMTPMSPRHHAQTLGEGRGGGEAALVSRSPSTLTPLAPQR